MAATKRDYYEILGVAKDASTDDIERAFRKLARQFHPDRNIGDKDAEAKFKEALEAHEVLVHEEKRERYDRYGHAGVEGMTDPGHGGATSFADIMNDLFGSFMGGGRRSPRGPQRGSDLRMALDIDLSEAAAGIKKQVKVRRHEVCLECSGTGSKNNKRATCNRCRGRGEFVQRQGFFELRQSCPACNGAGTVIADPCATCHGAARVQVERSIQVTVPPGADSGLRLLVGGEGDAGEPGAPRGDLELVVRVAEHRLFHRQGADLFVEGFPLTFSQAALGATLDVPTLTGRARLTVPPGTQTGTEFRIRNEGMPELRINRQGAAMEHTRKGDLCVTVVVETPTQLTKRHEELLRELAEIEHKQVSPQRKGFLDKIKDLFTSPDTEPNR
jgi:molecular chaperone DnaJ